MKVKEFLNLLPRQAIWKYELKFSGFTDKEEAEIASIIPKVTEDGRPLLKLLGKIQKNNRKLQYKGSLNRGFLLFYTETDILLTEQNQQKKGVKLNIL